VKKLSTKGFWSARTTNYTIIFINLQLEQGKTPVIFEDHMLDIITMDVGMFTGRVCLSLMAILECASMEKQKQRSKLSEEENNMQRSNLRRDNVLRCVDEIPYIKARRRIRGHGL
jgi:hypothetical protein